MAAIDVAPSLQGISADSLFEVMTYLTGTDVAVVAQTCKGMRDATNDKQLWRHIYWSEFQTQFGARVSLRIRDPKAVYKTRVEERKRRIRERTRQREDYHQRVAAVPRKKAVRKVSVPAASACERPASHVPALSPPTLTVPALALRPRW